MMDFDVLCHKNYFSQITYIVMYKHFLAFVASFSVKVNNVPKNNLPPPNKFGGGRCYEVFFKNFGFAVNKTDAMIAVRMMDGIINEPLYPIE